MRCLFLDIQRPAASKLTDPSNAQDLGSGNVSISRRFEKPMREFSLKSWERLFRDQMEIIRNEIHAGRITAIANFDGDQWGNITEPIFIAEGNGSQLEFPMPFDNCFPSSWKIWVGQTLNTAWTMPGDVLTFSSAPTGRITGIGKRWFRVRMVDNSDSVLGESQVYTNTDGDGVYEMEDITLREVQGTSIA